MIIKKEWVWPLWLRAIHWIVAMIIVLNAFFLDGDLPHQILGYVAAAAVLVRILMGFIGEGFHRLSHFPLKFSDLQLFFRTHFKRTHHYEGHNPVASYVYLLMWLLVVLLAVSGWMLGLDAFWGDERLEEIHEWFSNALVFLTIMHLMGVLADAILYKRKTWMAMISGKVSDRD